MRRLTVLTLALIALASGSWQLYGDAAQEAQDTAGGSRLKTFMQRKLDHSKAILQALALEDYAQMEKNAQDLSLLSLESNWNTITTEEYIQQSSDFRRACKVIQDAAREKNVDRATLGFVNLTVRCVECHKYLRSDAAQLPAKAKTTEKTKRE